MGEAELAFENAKRALSTTIKRGTKKAETTQEWQTGNTEARKAIENRIIEECHAKRTLKGSHPDQLKDQAETAKRMRQTGFVDQDSEAWNDNFSTDGSEGEHDKLLYELDRKERQGHRSDVGTADIVKKHHLEHNKTVVRMNCHLLWAALDRLNTKLRAMSSCFNVGAME